MSQKIRNNQLQDELEYRGDASVATHLHVCAYDERGVDMGKGHRLSDVEGLISKRRQHWLPRNQRRLPRDFFLGLLLS